jgi:hypothetical protein
MHGRTIYGAQQRERSRNRTPFAARTLPLSMSRATAKAAEGRVAEPIAKAFRFVRPSVGIDDPDELANRAGLERDAQDRQNGDLALLRLWWFVATAKCSALAVLRLCEV